MFISTVEGLEKLSFMKYCIKKISQCILAFNFKFCVIQFCSHMKGKAWHHLFIDWYKDGVIELRKWATVPTHVVFLNHVVCVNSLNQVCGIWTILSALFTQIKSRLKKTTCLNQLVYFRIYYKKTPYNNFHDLIEHTIQHFLQP